MEDFFIPMILVLFVLLIGGCAGRSFAHNELATECQRLGAFYVGQKTFECRLKPVEQK